MALLFEPDHRIEGPAPDVMRVVFETTFSVLALTMDDQLADELAHRLLRHTAANLTDAGYLVRQIGDGE